MKIGPSLSWHNVIGFGVRLSPQQLMPKQVAGFLPGGDQQMQHIYTAVCAGVGHSNNICHSGFALDLKRCFNTIGHSSAAFIMRAIGVREAVVGPWQRSLHSLTRTWNVQGLNSPPCPTNNGLPEGRDPMSVTAMHAIAFSWIEFVQRSTRNVTPTAFADNWGWSTGEPTQSEPALGATKHAAWCLNMIMDWKKSWMWSTHKQHLPLLKQAVMRGAPQEQVPDMLSAMDLGAQLAYRDNARLGKLKDLIHKAKTRLQRLETQAEPLPSKARRHCRNLPSSHVWHGTHTSGHATYWQPADIGGKCSPWP